MSLIDEALKRAQAAQGSGAASSSDPKPSASRWPAPVPLPDRRVSGTRTRILFFSLLAGGAIAFGVILLWPRAPRRTAATAAAPALAPKSRAPASASAEVAAPGGSQPQGSESRRRRTRPAPAGQSPEAIAPAAAASAAEKSAPSEKRRGEPEPKTYVGEAPIPGGGKIELGGIVYSEERPVALVNGRVLSAGSVVDGFTLAEIREDRVELRGPDRTIVIRLR